jgi:hypothetical protein
LGRRTLLRRCALAAGVGLAGYLFTSTDAPPEGGRTMTRPSVGFNLVSWAAETNTNPNPWLAAIADIAELGIRRVTMVCYRFLDGASGSITNRSVHGLVAGPTDSVIAAVLDHGRVNGFDVGILPFVEVDNPDGIGRVWRGSVAFDRSRLATFFSNYEKYILDVATIARNGAAARFYIGSELAALTRDKDAATHWLRLIDAVRGVVGRAPSCRLSYAANFDELDHVPFWADLDEIGVDAYYPLASKSQAKGLARPTEETLTRGWSRNLNALRNFSDRQRQRLTISEWGAVPFDLTSTMPWHWQPSETPDPAEQSHAYQALLHSIRNESHWLSACDIWHWRMPGNDGSAYGIEGASEVARHIRAYAAGEE